MFKSKSIARVVFGVLTLLSAVLLFIGLMQGSLWGIFAGIFLVAVGVSGVFVLERNTQIVARKHQLLVARILLNIVLVMSVVIVFVAALNGILWGIATGVSGLAVALGGMFLVSRNTGLR